MGVRTRRTGVVCAGRVLDGYRDAVVAQATLVKVVILEVERLLREAVSVGDVVDRVHDVERVDTCDVGVLGRRRGLGEVRQILEHEAAVRLRGDVRRRVLEGGRVVALGRGRVLRAVVVPAEGRGLEVLRVDERLKAVRGDLLPDGEHVVLDRSLRIKPHRQSEITTCRSLVHEVCDLNGSQCEKTQLLWVHALLGTRSLTPVGMANLRSHTNQMCRSPAWVFCKSALRSPSRKVAVEAVAWKLTNDFTNRVIRKANQAASCTNRAHE